MNTSANFWAISILVFLFYTTTGGFSSFASVKSTRKDFQETLATDLRGGEMTKLNMLFALPALADIDADQYWRKFNEAEEGFVFALQ